jgi:hypothetical protein
MCEPGTEHRITKAPEQIAQTRSEKNLTIDFVMSCKMLELFNEELDDKHC